MNIVDFIPDKQQAEILRNYILELHKTNEILNRNLTNKISEINCQNIRINELVKAKKSEYVS
jgi:hypothetical protein